MLYEVITISDGKRPLLNDDRTELPDFPTDHPAEIFIPKHLALPAQPLAEQLFQCASIQATGYGDFRVHARHAAQLSGNQPFRARHRAAFS